MPSRSEEILEEVLERIEPILDDQSIPRAVYEHVLGGLISKIQARQWALKCKEVHVVNEAGVSAR